MEYETEDGPWDPNTGGTSASLGTAGSLMKGLVRSPLEGIRSFGPDAPRWHKISAKINLVSKKQRWRQILSSGAEAHLCLI